MKKNGKIEILRFLFCISVLMFHAGYDALGTDSYINQYFNFFSKGRTGVEFFFIVSGFLAAKSAFKNRTAVGSTGNKTFNFILNKIKTILPYHIFALVPTFIILYFNSENFIIEFANRFPGVFFLQRTGMNNHDLISVEWYICSMLIALSIIYPFLLKYFDFTTLVVSPVLSSLLIGYLVKTYGAMPSSYSFGKYTYACNIRGFALVLLGCFCYAVCEKIKAANLTKLQKFALIAAENISWIISLYYIVSNINIRYESYVIYFMALGVTLTFTRDFNGFYNNSFVYFLGKITLPLYLCQNVARSIGNTTLHFLQPYQKIVAVFLIALALGVLSYVVCNAVKRSFLRKRQKSENIA